MLNAAFLMGRLTADPELKSTQSGIPVTSFTLAVDKAYKSGEDRQADFIDLVAWRGTAEVICKYFRKGQMMIAEGAIQTRTYEDRNGNKRKAVEVVVSHVSFAGPKENSSPKPAETPAYDPDLPFAGDPNGPLPGTKEFKKARQMNLAGDLEPVEFTDDDLPF